MTVKCLSRRVNVHLRFAAVQEKSFLFILAMFIEIFLCTDIAGNLALLVSRGFGACLHSKVLLIFP